jgi:pimeloyl-ACP methyl ester carboxylesterase
MNDYTGTWCRGGDIGHVKLNRPVTLVYGDEDWSRPSDRQANIESVPGARDLVLPETGHFAALEAPDEVARILLDDAR